MPILDKKLLLEEIEKRLNDFVPTNMAKRILAEADDAMQSFDVITIREGNDKDGEDLIKLFLEAKECEGRSKGTLSQYKKILGKMQKAIGVPIKSVTVYHLRSFLMAEKERGLTPGTIENIRSTCSSFFGWLHAEGIIERNPTSNLAPTKQPKEIRMPFTAVEVEKLRDSVETLRDAALIDFLLATGCRVSEVCSIDRNDIDFHSLRLKVTGKGSKQRTVYLDDVTAMRLTKYLKSRNDFSPALFDGRGTQRMTPSGVRKTLTAIAKRAGVENVHPHRFRRTLATNLIDHGMSVQEVATILGHDKLDTTMGYVFINQRNVENSYRRFA